MSTARLSFMDSPYFYGDDEGWHLKEDAPEEVKQEFEEYMEYSKEMEDNGVFI